MIHKSNRYTDNHVLTSKAVISYTPQGLTQGCGCSFIVNPKGRGRIVTKHCPKHKSSILRSHSIDQLT
jgi:hypothetical protein